MAVVNAVGLIINHDVLTSRGEDGKTILCIAIEYLNIGSLDYEERLKMVKYLVEKGANVNAKSKLGDHECTPLELAASKGLFDLAVQKGHLEIVRSLISKNTPKDLIDVKASDGKTLLCIAIESLATCPENALALLGVRV